jgi:hypothetical protein
LAPLVSSNSFRLDNLNILLNGVSRIITDDSKNIMSKLPYAEVIY